MSPQDSRVAAKAGGMADVVAGIITALSQLGADIHVAIPNYRTLFCARPTGAADRYALPYPGASGRRVHFAEDNLFYHKSAVYDGDTGKTSLRFQREVIHHIIPDVEPDLIHCNDWMTGLIPAVAASHGIPSLFTIHNIHTQYLTLHEIEDSGIAARDFWQRLYYRQMPGSYEETRRSIPVDLLTSGIFASNHVNTVSPTFLAEIAEGNHGFVPDPVRREVRCKLAQDRASGVLNAPATHYDPRVDATLAVRYDAADHAAAKAENKAAFQQAAQLRRAPDAPLLFWPSRLDPVQKGCELLAEILPAIMNRYASPGAQIAIVADGPGFGLLRAISSQSSFAGRIALFPFNEALSRLAFAASDFTLMPSRFEPCGLPQMIGAIYGSVPIVHSTGGLRDTVSHLSVDGSTGNGFVFDHYDGAGMVWALDQAMRFYCEPPEVRRIVIERIMNEAAARFDHETMGRAYLELYEKILARPIVERERQAPRSRNGAVFAARMARRGHARRPARRRTRQSEAAATLSSLGRADHAAPQVREA